MELNVTIAERGIYLALIYALVAERLSLYYEHHQWITTSQGSTLAADWLARRKFSLSSDTRKHLSALSDQLARQIADSLSREAGLYATHEMMESLDANYHSDIGQSIMLECEQILDSNPLGN
jgi:hypothetical protein